MLISDFWISNQDLKNLWGSMLSSFRISSIYKSLGSKDCLHQLHLVSDSMYFSEESYSLFFFFMPFFKDVQRGWLGHVQVLHPWGMLSEAIRLVFLSLFWLRGLGYGLSIFQCLKLRDKEKEQDPPVLIHSLITVNCTSCSQKCIKMCNSLFYQWINPCWLCVYRLLDLLRQEFNCTLTL